MNEMFTQEELLPDISCYNENNSETNVLKISFSENIPSWIKYAGLKNFPIALFLSSQIFLGSINYSTDSDVADISNAATVNVKSNINNISIDIDEWRDTAHLVPQVVSKVKLNIKLIKHLEFSSIEGEFDFEED